MGGTVGFIVNPLAGKDIRRLVTAASHTPDSAKIGIVRRAIIAAAEAGASRLLVADDPHHLARRAIDGTGLQVEVLDEPLTGTRADTIGAAARLWKEHAGAVVVLGGDGTCRDVANGWPDAPLIAVSTGTNNVFPNAIDATSAGTAAAFVARGAIDVAAVCHRCKRVSVRIDTGHEVHDDLALVDLALIDTTFVGSRAVLDPHAVRIIIAAISTPSSTGLSSIAGRLQPVSCAEPGGVLVRLGPGGRRLRVPLSPGTFTTVSVDAVVRLADGEEVVIDGPGVLAFDGERDRRINAATRVNASVERAGPLLIDVDHTLQLAAAARLFEEHHDGH